MKYIGSRFKGLFLSIILLSIFIFLFSLLVPTRITATKIFFNPSDTIVQQLSNVNTWKKWYAPLAQDSNLTPLYSANTQGVGAFIKYGDNTVTITKVTPNEVLFEVRNNTGANIKGGFTIKNVTTNVTTADTNMVSWYYITGSKWLPWQRFRSIALDKAMKPEMRKSLDDFANLLNNGAIDDSYLVNEDFCDDSILVYNIINKNILQTEMLLIKEAAAFKNKLIANGCAENNITNSFYIYDNNNKTYLAFGLKTIDNIKQATINIPNYVKQIEVLKTKENGLTTTVANDVIKKYIIQKKYNLWQGIKLQKYINWQYATLTQPATVKIIWLVQ